MKKLIITALLSLIIDLGTIDAKVNVPPGGRHNREIRHDKREIRHDRKKLHHHVKKGNPVRAKHSAKQLRKDKRELRHDRKARNHR